MAERPSLFRPNGECTELRRILGKDFLTRSFLEEFRPLPEMYLRPDAIYGLHGEGHSARVNILGQTLAQLLALRGIEVDRRTVGYVSQTHDLRRVDDKHDVLHGERAAAYINEVRGVVPVRFLPAVSYLNTWHVPDDHLAPAMTYPLALIKDGDGGDRIREEGALDISYLRLPETPELIVKPAWLLYHLSVQIEKQYGLRPFDASIQAGIEMGMIGDR